MSKTQQAPWSPKLFQKQVDLIADMRSGAHRFILAAGPRFSGKTVAALHGIVDNAWNTDRANWALVSVSQSAGFDSGVWTDLTETIIPEWIEAGFGLQWKKPPSIQHVSKKPYCSIINRFGTESKFQLESLKNEAEVESRFKGKRYSGMFINELSNFRHRKTLDTWSECLRMLHLPPEKHLLIADTNPADEGSKSWIYRTWFEFPLMQEHPDGKPLTPPERKLQQLLSLHEFSIDDNIFAPPERIEQLKGMLSSNPDLYARYILGRWVTSSLDALFVDVFKEHIHVIGEEESSANLNPEMMDIEDGCYELYTGWDLGVVNSAAVIVEKTFATGSRYPIFKQLDELVITGEDFSMDDFVYDFVQKMMYWAERAGDRKLKWTHWSDRSAFDMKEPSSRRYHHQIVFDASPLDTPGGRIVLQAAERGPNSIRQRVDLFRKLLWEDRVFISRAKCPQSIEMVKSIKKGKTQLAPIEKGSRHKHVFDALTYCIASECYDELANLIMRTIRPRTSKESSFVSVPL